MEVGFPGGGVVKTCLPTHKTPEMWVRCLDPEDPEKEMQPAAVFLPGKSHGQRSLVGYSLWCHKESDRTVAWFRKSSLYTACWRSGLSRIAEFVMYIKVY